MSGKRSKEKGKRGEREAAKAVSEILNIPMRRGQQFSGLGGDDVTGWSGIHIEVKRTERLNLYAAIEQSARDTASNCVMPIVMHRKNGKPWVVCCYLDDLAALSTRVAEALKEASQP